MGNTVRREPVNFDIPASPNYKFLNITNFRGLDVSSNPFELATNTASDCLNVYVDETNTLTTRPRLCKKEFKNANGEFIVPLGGTCIGVYNLHNGYLLHHIIDDKPVMRLFIDGVLKDPVSGEIPSTKCNYFEHGDSIYLLTGEKYVVIKDNTLKDVVGYVPKHETITVEGTLVKAEDLNLLSDKYKQIIAWNDRYITDDLLNDPETIDVEPFWEDKTDALTDAGIDSSVEFCAVYSDGSFCVKKDKNIIYYYSEDNFDTLIPITVFAANPNYEYLYTFAKESKTFAVLRKTFDYFTHHNVAQGFRMENNVWKNYEMLSVDYDEGDTFIDWKFSKNGTRMIYVKLLPDSSGEIRLATSTASNSNKENYASIQMDSYQNIDYSSTLAPSELRNITDIAVFNGDKNISGILSLSGRIIEIDENELKTSQKGAFADYDIFDYSDDGSNIVLDWTNVTGITINDFNWEDANIIKSTWKNRPTINEPIKELKPWRQTQAKINSTEEAFVTYSLAWSRKGSEFRDVYYTGNVLTQNFTGESKGVLNLAIPKDDTQNVFVNFDKIIVCVGENPHLYIKQSSDIDTITIIKQLTTNHADYATWKAKRTHVISSKLYTRFDNNHWFAKDNFVFISKHNDPTYFPITEYDDLGDANSPITGFNVANDTTLLAYKTDRLYLIQPHTSLNTREYSVTESKNTVGNTAVGAPIVTTLTEIPLQINYDGIYGLSQLQNVSAVERIADLMSEPINDRWLNEDDVVIKKAMTLNRLYWTYIILPYTTESSVDKRDVTKIYLLDNRTNSWYYWELPIKLLEAFSKDNRAEFVDTDGNIYYLTTTDIKNVGFDTQLVTEYYDDGKKLINWFWQSQILPMGTMNYAKRLVNTTFILTDTDTQDGYGLKYNFKVFRKLASSTPEKEINDELNLVRSTTKKTNISKFGFIQLKISNITEESQGTEAEKAYRNNKLRLVGLGLKYVLLEGLIR